MARPRTPKGRARETAVRLADEYPGSAQELCALDFANPFQLLVATVLSAQTTDEQVNLVTPKVFARYPDAGRPGSRRPGGAGGAHPFHRLLPFQGEEPDRSRAARSTNASAGTVPHTMEELVTLPGVGRKTANVVLSVGFGLPGLPVDTHVTRLTKLLGLTESTDPVRIESDVTALLPRVRVGCVQPAPDPARPPGLRRPAASVRASACWRTSVRRPSSCCRCRPVPRRRRTRAGRRAATAGPTPTRAAPDLRRPGGRPELDRPGRSPGRRWPRARPGLGARAPSDAHRRRRRLAPSGLLEGAQPPPGGPEGSLDLEQVGPDDIPLVAGETFGDAGDAAHQLVEAGGHGTQFGVGGHTGTIMDPMSPPASASQSGTAHARESGSGPQRRRDDAAAPVRTC